MRAHNFIDIAGQRFGRWNVLSYAGNSLWVCRCDCGAEKSVRARSLRIGTSTGCKACARYESTRTHGQSGHPAWSSYVTIINYHRSGRAVVCEEWVRDPALFIQDMHSKPRRSMLRRVDASKPYSRDNCFWLPLQPTKQKKPRRLYECGGEWKDIRHWARVFGVSEMALGTRLRHGQYIKDAVHGIKTDTPRVADHSLRMARIANESALSHETLCERLSYNPETGQFTRLSGWSGKKVGRPNASGHIQISINNVRFQAHRLAWFYVHKAWPRQIHHIDHDPSNNRISNLMEVTTAENVRFSREFRRSKRVA